MVKIIRHSSELVMKTKNKNRFCFLNQTDLDLCIALVMHSIKLSCIMYWFLLPIFLVDIHHVNQFVFMTLVLDTKPFIIYLQNIWLCESLKYDKHSISNSILIQRPYHFQYFKTKPYACDPSTLPIYPPSKEIDAKHREESRWGWYSLHILCRVIRKYALVVTYSTDVSGLPLIWLVKIRECLHMLFTWF